jgi:hypothetical protein
MTVQRFDEDGRVIIIARGRRVSASSSESSTQSMSSMSACFTKVRDIVGAANTDSSGASLNSRPGYLPSSGWGR